MPWTGIAAAGVNLLGGLIGSKSSANLNKDNRNWSHDEGVYQRDWSSQEAVKQRQWEEQMYNQYNSPSAMMRQYREAGINPFLNADVGSSMSTSGGLPSGSSAPSPTQFNSGTPLQEGLSSAVGALLQTQSVDANSANQRSQSLMSGITAAVEASKFFGVATGRQILDIVFKNYGGSNADFNRATELSNNYLEQSNLSIQRDRVTTEIAKKTGLKSAENMISIQEQQWTRMAAEIGEMASRVRVNDMTEKELSAKIRLMASEYARNFAQSGLFKAMSGQINTLLPLMESSMIVGLGSQSMSFLTQLGNFNQESAYRDWQNTDKAKSAYKASMSMDDRNNVIGMFMRNFISRIPLNVGVNYSPGKSSFMQSGEDWSRFMQSTAHD